MERLTKREYGEITYSKNRDIMCGSFCNSCSVGTGNCNTVKAMVEKLAEYEDLEEQGRLLRLPCKKGDIVWELCKCDDGVFRIFPMEVKVFIPYGELRYASRSYSMWNIYAESDYTKMYKSFYDIGTSLFLTQEEAEAKLAEMEESHD